MGDTKAGFPLAQRVKLPASKPDLGLHTWDPHGGKREPTPASCPLISTCCRDTCTCSPHTYIHTVREGHRKPIEQTKNPESGSWLTELGPSGSLLAGGPVKNSGTNPGVAPLASQLRFGGGRLPSTALISGPAVPSDATSGMSCEDDSYLGSFYRNLQVASGEATDLHWCLACDLFVWFWTRDKGLRSVFYISKQTWP